MNSNNKPKKTSKGKAKIPIKFIPNKNSRYVTFSKRKGGLFKKAASFASEAEIAVIVLSPTGKPFTFGYPNPDAVINRFLGQQGIGNEDKNKKKEEEKGLFWWDDVNVDELSLDQLVELKSSLEELQTNAFERALDYICC